MAAKKSDDPPAPFNNPFGALAERRGQLPPGPVREKRLPAAPARAVLRLERKGHGGKEVTVVDKLDLPDEALEQWLLDLKGALGCGGRVDGGALVLQGDQRERLQPLLRERGVRKVVG